MLDKGKGKVRKATVSRKQRGKGSQGGKVENELLGKGKGKRMVAEVSGSSTSQLRKSSRVFEQKQNGGPQTGSRAGYHHPLPLAREIPGGAVANRESWQLGRPAPASHLTRSLHLTDVHLYELHPLLFLGDRHAATNKDWVEKQKFGAVVNMAKDFKVAPKLRVPGVDYNNDFAIDDSGEADLCCAYDGLCVVLNRWFKEGKTVLVHCRAGRSRYGARTALLEQQRSTCN